jgi:hypothetical protein
MAMPISTRPTRKTGRLVAATTIPVPARNTADAAMIERRRPILSARRPPAIAPRIAPTSTELVATSSKVAKD